MELASATKKKEEEDIMRTIVEYQAYKDHEEVLKHQNINHTKESGEDSDDNMIANQEQAAEVSLDAICSFNTDMKTLAMNAF